MIGLVAGAALVAGCYDDTITSDKVRGTTSTAADPLFQTYVAIGNSITAGIQSSGINDSTQRQSYAYLLATQSMKTRFAYPSFSKPGCPPPTLDLTTGAKVGQVGTTAPPACSLRNPASENAVLNNLGVPGAAVIDVTSPTSGAFNPPSALPTFILGGKTQIQRAMEARPTFVSVWIGNNDVLNAAGSGLLSPNPALGALGYTDSTTFKSRFQGIVDSLKKIPTLKGAVLIGVVKVASAPILFPVGALIASPAFKQGFDTFVGKPTTILPSCTTAPGNQALVSFAIIPQIRSGALPPIISCAANTPAPPVGDLFILDASEQATLNATVDAYNNFIKAQANANNWAYYDPNVTLAAQRVPGGCIATVPDFTTFAPVNGQTPVGENQKPFGACMSLDGVHPRRAGQVIIANEIIKVINAKYGTQLQPVS